MWWVPLATALFLGVLVTLLHLWQHRRQLNHSKVYRARYQQLVAQLETVSKSVNQMEKLVRGVKEPKALDYYESTLRILETLLAAIKKLPPFGTEPEALDSAFFLVKDCRLRVGRTQQAFQDSVRGRPVRLDALYGTTAKDPWKSMAGCYFCSRPVIAERFSQVKVRIDGSVKEVLSCKVCRDELESTKKVKVLYFMKDGRPVHWSQAADYHPSEDYWNINKRDPIRKTTKLELVYSQPERLLDKDKSRD